VDFSSAQQSARDNSYKVEDANHMEVCKPPSKEHPSYGLLLQFIITCQEVSFNNLVFSILRLKHYRLHKMQLNFSVRRQARMLEILMNYDCVI
jgi:hypothetical protein